MRTLFNENQSNSIQNRIKFIECDISNVDLTKYEKYLFSNEAKSFVYMQSIAKAGNWSIATPWKSTINRS